MISNITEYDKLSKFCKFIVIKFIIEIIKNKAPIQ